MVASKINIRRKSKLLFTGTNSLMYEIKTGNAYEVFRSAKEKFDFSNYSNKWKYYDNSNKLVIGEMKVNAAIEEFVALKTKIYSLLLDNKEHKKAKKKNVVSAMNYNGYKDALLNKKCIRHSINRIRCKDHWVRINKINQISLCCFDDKMYIQNNGFNELILGCQS